MSKVSYGVFSMGWGRTLLVVLALTLSGTSASAQSVFGKGETLLSIGYLTGSDFPGPGGAIGLEHGILEMSPQVVLGLGALGGYRREDIDNPNRFAFSGPAENRVPIMGTVNVHVIPTRLKVLDVWAGVSVGVVRSAFEASNGTEKSESASAVQVGARLNLVGRVSAFGQAMTGDLGRAWFGGSVRF